MAEDTSPGRQEPPTLQHQNTGCLEASSSRSPVSRSVRVGITKRLLQATMILLVAIGVGLIGLSLVRLTGTALGPDHVMERGAAR